MINCSVLDHLLLQSSGIPYRDLDPVMRDAHVHTVFAAGVELKLELR